MCIQELDLEIKYKPGKHNTNADALSRNPIADTAVTCAMATKQASAEEVMQTESVGDGIASTANAGSKTTSAERWQSENHDCLP